MECPTAYGGPWEEAEGILMEFIVCASRDLDGREPRQIGMTPSYAEALEWLEQARMDGWATAWIEQAPMD